MKVVLADRIGISIDSFNGTLDAESGLMNLSVALLYSFQIYGDFAGYSFMALGVGELMGFELNKRHKNLIVFLEIDRCMADAVQSVTKCTMGKRSLKQMYYGKFAVTFYNMDTGEAIRVSDADANKQEKIRETRDEMIERFKRTPAEELFNVEKVHVELKPSQMPGKPHTSTYCSICGEKITDGRHLNRGGKPVCIPCAEGAYYEIIDE
jgi:formylmethanofuran dehydrogenase subunit E